jgi:hypothetical protein
VAFSHYGHSSTVDFGVADAGDVLGITRMMSRITKTPTDRSSGSSINVDGGLVQNNHSAISSIYNYIQMLVPNGGEQGPSQKQKPFDIIIHN